MGIGQHTHIGPYIVAKSPLVEVDSFISDKICTICNVHYPIKSEFCTVHGKTLVDIIKKREVYKYHSKYLEDSEEMFQPSCWMEKCKDELYLPNLTYLGSFSQEDEEIIHLENINMQGYIESFKQRFATYIEELSKTYEILEFHFGIIRYWA